jgi:hypothetical protein
VICSPVGCGVYSSLSPDPASRKLAAFLFRSSWIDVHDSSSLLPLACVFQFWFRLRSFSSKALIFMWIFV